MELVSAPLQSAIPNSHQAMDTHGPPLSFHSHQPSLSHKFSTTTLADNHSHKPHLGSIAETEDSSRIDWLPDDRENPKLWSVPYKWMLTLFCGVLTLNSTFASSAPSMATRDIIEQFDVSSEVETLITSLFLCGYVAGPLFWAPLSEFIGRRPVFIGTMFAYFLLQLGETLSRSNFHLVLVIRFLSGASASAPLTNCGGVIADIWDPYHRAQAISVFTASAFIGTVLGPIVGGFVTESRLGFRWIFWLMMVLGGASLILVVFGIPETYAPILLAQRAKRRRVEENRPELHSDDECAESSIKRLLHKTLLRPFKMISSEPILVLVTVYLSIVYGLLYGLFEAFPIIWGDLRGFTTSQLGLLFIGVGIGATLGAGLSILLQRPLKSLIPKWHGHPPCEVHLYASMLAGPFLLIGILWLGWTGVYASIPWWIPAISTVCLGASFTLVYISSQAYLIDVYLEYSASALAANTICRSAVGAAFPLFTRQMFEGLGVQWAATMIGGISLLIIPAPFIFYKYGASIRARSKFAPSLDLQMKAVVEAEEQKEEYRYNEATCGEKQTRSRINMTQKEVSTALAKKLPAIV